MLHHSSNRGYTLAEVIIAMTISIILIAGATATYISQNRSYVAQESVSEVNTQSKIAHTMIANDLRTAGFGAPTDMNLEPVNGLTDKITQLDNTTAPDAITIVGGFRMIGTLWPSGGGPGMACPATVPMGDSQINIEYAGNEGPNMADKRFISIDGVNFAQVANCTLQTVDNKEFCTFNSITLDRSLSQNFPLTDTDGDGLCDTGRPVYLVEDVTFCVDASRTLHRIRRNADAAACTGQAGSDDDTVAENIEDLQFAYGTDADDDGMIDGAFANSTADPEDIVAVRINILARTDRADPNYTGLGNPPPVIENRNHAPANDDFRRRWWQTTVTMRNR